MLDTAEKLVHKHKRIRRCVLQIDSLRWHVRGKPNPPPKTVKYSLIKSYLVKLKIAVIVETGTYLGDFVAYMIDLANDIYSIEISPSLYDNAKKRFCRSSKVHLTLGDSTEVLPGILAEIRNPCFFWLDAHCSVGITSGDRNKSPVMEELKMILDHSALHGIHHLIIVDDARDFTGQNGYPTVPEVENVVTSTIVGWVCEVRSDMIHIHSPDMLI